MKYYDSIDVCRQIRSDHAEERLDAGKGKKCPGGYWIPANKQCGKPGQAGKSGRMRSPGGGKMARNLAIGAAGTLALGAGGAALAYKNRDKIIAGVDKAGSAATKKATEMKIAVRKGVGEAQGKIQRASEKAGKAAIGASRRVSVATTKMAAGASQGARDLASKAESGVARGKEMIEQGKSKVKSGAKKAKETFSNIASSGSKGEDKK